MKLDGSVSSACAESLYNSKDLSVYACCCGVMAYFLVSCFFDWMWEPGTEQRQREQSLKLRQYHADRDGAFCTSKPNSCDKAIKEERCASSVGQKNFLKSHAIWLESHKGAKNSLQFDYNMSTEAACQYGYDFRFRHSISIGGANPHTADMRAGRTGLNGLNLHLILVILFSTNKLTPEKT